MRIMSFTQMWPKLQQPEFTTFRYPRKDRDWAIGETVQVFFKNRSPNRKKLGVAEIVNQEDRFLTSRNKRRYAGYLVTDAEAKADGFPGLKEMMYFLKEEYDPDYDPYFHKLTLRWRISRE